MRGFVLSAAAVLLAAGFAVADEPKKGDPKTGDAKKADPKVKDGEKKDGDKVANLYPLAKGNKWEYELTVNGMTVAVTQEVTEVARAEKKGERDVATISTDAAGMTITEEASADAKGVYKHSFQNMKLDKPLMAVKYPVKAGDAWKEEVKVGGQEFTANMEAKETEEVKVAAGTYKAVPVVTKATVMGQDLESTTYYADGVGIVKQEVSIAGIKVVMELKKFTAGKATK